MNRLVVLALGLWLATGAAWGQTPPNQGSLVPNTPPWNSLYPANTFDNSAVYNYTSSNLNHYRAALARVRAGTTRGTILNLGDSTTMGAGAGASGTLNETGAYPLSSISDLSALMQQDGYPVSFQSFLGNQAAAVYNTYDTRVTYGTGWGFAQQQVGGFAFKFTTGTGSNLTFTPPGAFDTIIIYSLQSAGLGSFTTNVDGGASLGTINAAGANALIATTYTVTRGTHTYNIVPNNDGTAIYIAGVITYDSTVKRMDMLQAGYSGAFAVDVSGSANPWAAVPFITALAPDLCTVNLTINDSDSQTDLTTYSSQIATIIQTCQLSGDVILMVGIPSNTTQATDGTLDRYIAVLRQLAQQYGCVLIDLKARWTSYAVTNPIMPYRDTHHATNVGYQDVAQAMHEVLHNGPGSGSQIMSLSAPGTVAAPTLNFGNCGTGCGLYAPATNQVGLAVNGADILNYNISASNRFRFTALVEAASNINSSNSNGYSLIPNAASSTQPTFVPRRADLTTGIGSQASGNVSAIVGGAEIGRFIAGGFTLVSGQLNVTSMTQTSAAQSGTVCYNSGTGAVTYDATLGCLTSTLEAKNDWLNMAPEQALTIVKQLRPGTYTYKLGLGLPDGPQVGFAAEQVAQVDDRLVGYRPDGTLGGVRYQQTSALYAGAIRALQNEIDELKRKTAWIDALQPYAPHSPFAPLPTWQ